MKSQLLLISFLSLFLFSCSSDDDSGNPQEVETLFYLDKITYGDEDYDVELYPDHKVKKIEMIDFDYEISYENDLISNVVYTPEEGLVSSIDFEHDVNGKISSVIYDGEIVQQVAYNAQTRTYSFTKEDAAALDIEFSLKLNEVGDVENVTRFDPNTQETSTWGYQFDEANKGALWNSNSVSAYLYIIKPNSLDLMLPFNKKPVMAAQSGESIFNCTNEFNDKDYLTHTAVFISELTFHYTQE